MRPQHRVIVLAHLDDRTRDGIYDTVTRVLSAKKLPARKRQYLRRKLGPHKDLLRVLADSKRSRRVKAKVLPQVGAGPMTHVLGAAVPLLLNLFT